MLTSSVQLCQLYEMVHSCGFVDGPLGAKEGTQPNKRRFPEVPLYPGGFALKNGASW